jgi:hypothetical protein
MCARPLGQFRVDERKFRAERLDQVSVPGAGRARIAGGASANRLQT